MAGWPSGLSCLGLQYSCIQFECGMWKLLREVWMLIKSVNVHIQKQNQWRYIILIDWWPNEVRMWLNSGHKRCFSSGACVRQHGGNLSGLFCRRSNRDHFGVHHPSFCYHSPSVSTRMSSSALVTFSTNISWHVQLWMVISIPLFGFAGVGCKTLPES